MVRITNYFVHVALMVMVIVLLEVMGANVTLDGQDGFVIKSVLLENMDRIV